MLRSGKRILPAFAIRREARRFKVVHGAEELSTESLLMSKVGAIPTSLCAVIFVNSGVGILLKSTLDPFVWYNVRTS